MILVTGGAGYIGSHTVKALLEQGYEVVVVDNLENGHRKAIMPNAVRVDGDLLEYDWIRLAFKHYKIDAVLHFAAYASVGDSVTNPAKYFRNNIVGGLNLLKAMKEYSVGKIVFSSSAAVYGEPQYTPIDEDHPKQPTNPYGETKLMFENILKWYDLAYGIKSISLRYFCAAGADPSGEIGEDHNPEEHLIPNVIKAAMDQTRTVKIFGTDWNTRDGTCIRDFVHVSDLADAHILALRALQNGAPSNAYNLGSGIGFTVEEVINEVQEITGRGIRVEHVGRRPGDPQTLIASTEKICRELGWTPKRSNLPTIIEDAWRWHSTHPNGYADRWVVGQFESRER